MKLKCSSVVLLVVPAILCGCEIAPRPVHHDYAEERRRSSEEEAEKRRIRDEEMSKEAARKLDEEIDAPNRYPPPEPFPSEPTNYQEAVKTFMRSVLKDPDSALYKDWSIGKAYQGSRPPVYGWMIHVQINAKNSFGGYTGYELHQFWLYEGKVTESGMFGPHIHQLLPPEWLRELQKTRNEKRLTAPE